MSNLSHIQAPIAGEMADFEQKFRAIMKSRVALLDTIMSFIVRRKGKQIRPTLVFLAAGICGQIADKTHRGAALIELLHTATLVHDDVVDDSDRRRGFFSINALWKNKVAVLVGDYLLSRGLMLSLDHKDYEVLQLVNEAVKEMSEGELLQLEKARRLNITEAVYLDVIRQKTATLLKACCAVGAASVGADADTIRRMGLFGEKLGMAFQIKDDLFDYGSGGIGKPVGIDIKEKKMTLPLIHALRETDSRQRRHIIRLIKRRSEETAAVKEVIAFVKASGGIAYTTHVMERYQQEALDLLAESPDSAHKQAMLALIGYVIERKK